MIHTVFIVCTSHVDHTDTIEADHNQRSVGGMCVGKIYVSKFEVFEDYRCFEDYRVNILDSGKIHFSDSSKMCFSKNS